MINEAFLHCKGIGPVKLKQLNSLGFNTWQDVLATPSDVPFNGELKTNLIDEITRSQHAFTEKNLDYLCKSFVSLDQWRILGHFFDRASFFDIETSGLSYYDITTLIVCYHNGKLHQFVAGENLDDFIDMLDDIELLVSFNGSSFDVPKILDTFRIPELPCPHIDMRWLCYHSAYRGGLKAIAQSMGFHRPQELSDVNGMDAITLWNQWKYDRDHESRSLLIRYCCSDVILLYLVAIQALTEKGYEYEMCNSDKLWQLIPDDI